MPLVSSHTIGPLTIQVWSPPDFPPIRIYFGTTKILEEVAKIVETKTIYA
jgi:hypothetical protein